MERAKEAGDGQHRPKRRQSRRLGHKYFFFKFFAFLYILTNAYIIHARYRPTDVLLQRGGQGKAKTTRKGPNDARRVVWALGMRFFFLRVFLILTNVYLYIHSTNSYCKPVVYARTGFNTRATRETRYPYLAVPIPVSAGMGFLRVRVRVEVKIPMGYPCYALKAVLVCGSYGHHNG